MTIQQWVKLLGVSNQEWLPIFMFEGYDLENLIKQDILIIIIVIGVVLFYRLLIRLNNKHKIITRYHYRAKPIMTRREEETFRHLTKVFERKFYVIPQVHLGSILNHEIRGQNWYGAFQHINRKSVDYVLLNKETLGVTCAIELDDRTHDWMERKMRDAEIERILREAGIPLVRFRSLSGYSDRETIALFAKVINDN